MVDVKVDTGDIEKKPESFFTQFDAVCLTSCSRDVIVKVDQICHKNSIKFFTGDVFGYHGYTFANLGEHEFVEVPGHGQPTGLQVDYVFRGVEHVVRVVVSGQALELEVEDRMTADQWRGEFDASFIEDLTHKTGNFKQFNIFCNMLESALTQSSESVTLDLLTYTDLESLRSRKLGGRPGALAPRSAQLNSKRYLILIYSVEFDRIHYPLPLPYQGKPDPVVLQGIIRTLKEELGRLRGLDRGQNPRDTRETEIWHLREHCKSLPLAVGFSGPPEARTPRVSSAC
uniref:centrosomal protein CCDC61-like isoform X2 n=1 Tax=Jaculus jaculus TaxID=51337 RepID=UPI001E1B14B3|nr:centrosomal protein CCDC61-like isoform X2 [Jaculus jaculus]